MNWKSSKKKKAKGKDKGQDLYLLLGLQNERWTANANQIKNGAQEQVACVQMGQAACLQQDQGCLLAAGSDYVLAAWSATA